MRGRKKLPGYRKLSGYKKGLTAEYDIWHE